MVGTPPNRSRKPRAIPEPDKGNGIPHSGENVILAIIAVVVFVVAVILLNGEPR